MPDGKILVICGPTCTGKTSLAVKVAKKLNTEIISSDSALIYRHLDIGTAKPSKEEMDGVVHHMIDVRNPDEDFSVQDYKSEALPVMKRIMSEGKVPIICGGTGFYIKSLLYDYSYAKAPKDESIRQKYEQMAQNEGKDAVYALLQQVDPESAKAIEKNNMVRVIRALEIYESSGIKKSELRDSGTKLYDFVAVGIDIKRDVLYERIHKRVVEMFKKGLVEEVQELINQGYANCQSMKAIGYKELVSCIQSGEDPYGDAVRELIESNTRKYAKRQRTFFNHQLEGIAWLSDKDANEENVLKILDENRL